MLNDEGGNPLAEVGLALSMAFFSLMILMLVAVLNSPSANQNFRTGEDGARLNREKMTFFVYVGGHLYDKDLNRTKIDALPKQQKILLAVDPQLELSAVLNIVGQVDNKNLQITKLDKAWQKRIRQIGVN